MAYLGFYNKLDDYPSESEWAGKDRLEIVYGPYVQVYEYDDVFEGADGAAGPLDIWIYFEVKDHRSGISEKGTFYRLPGLGAWYVQPYYIKAGKPAGHWTWMDRLRKYIWRLIRAKDLGVTDIADPWSIHPQGSSTGGGGANPWTYGGGWGHGLGTGSPAGSGWGGGGSTSSGGGWGSGVDTGGPSDWGRPDMGWGFGGGGGPPSGGGEPPSGGGGPPSGGGGPERTGGPQDDNDKRGGGSSDDQQGNGERQGGRGSNGGGKSGGGKSAPKKSAPGTDFNAAGFAFDDGGPAWVGGSAGAEGYNPNLVTDMRLGRGSRRTSGSAGSGPRFSDLFGDYRGGGAYDDVPDRNWVASIRGAFVDYAGVPLLTPGYGGDDGGGGNFGRSIGDGRRVGAGEGSYGSAGVAKDGERLLPNLRRPGFDVGETAGDPDRLDKFDHRGTAAPAAFAGVHRYVSATRGAASITTVSAPIAGALEESTS